MWAAAIVRETRERVAVVGAGLTVPVLSRRHGVDVGGAPLPVRRA